MLRVRAWPRAAGRRARVACIAAAIALLLAAPAAGDEPADSVLRVGTSGDYAPFSMASGSGRHGTHFEGFDVALARAYAAERGLTLEFVRFRWPRLLEDLAAHRFDVAMSGVTVRPDRSAGARFTVPVLETGAVLLVRDADRFPAVHAIDLPHVRVGVHAGGHLEAVARALLPHVTLLAIPDNTAVLRAMLQENVDAIVTDSVEASVWEQDSPALVRLGPFSRDRKALLVRADDASLAADLDAWLLAAERDGSLAQLRREHFDAATAAQVLATPLGALVAAVDERLALMPMLAIAKHRSGQPLVNVARETSVLDSVSAQVLALAQREGVQPPSFLAVRVFYRAVMEAAKEVQRKAAKQPDALGEQTAPDLETVLRPAIDRIGARIAALIVALGEPPSRDEARAAVLDGIRTERVSDASKRAIAEAIAGLGAAPADTASRATQVETSQ
jgi:cyclohexadienyl dehydratase